MKQDFETAELKRALECGLGFGLSSLRRLDGASALNFRAVRESDGLVFAVKCLPESRRRMFEHLIRHLDEVQGTKAVSRIFAQECPERFEGYSVICLTWCKGVRLFPDELTTDQLRDFLDDYLTFSTALQGASLILPADPTSDWRLAVLGCCRGLSGRVLRRLVERELPLDELTYNPERLRVIHGDFHHGNFLFLDGRLSGIFDLEEFCGGYPADDIVRWFVCAAEHLKWYEQGRKRAILARFAEAIRFLPYPPDEWLAAVDGLLMRKIYKKVVNRGPSIWQVANLFYRARFYHALKRTIRQIGPLDENGRNRV